MFTIIVWYQAARWQSNDCYDISPKIQKRWESRQNKTVMCKRSNFNWTELSWRDTWTPAVMATMWRQVEHAITNSGKAHHWD